MVATSFSWLFSDLWLGIVRRNGGLYIDTWFLRLSGIVEPEGEKTKYEGMHLHMNMMSAKICPTHLCKPTVILMLNLCDGAVLHPLTWVIRVKNVVAMSRASTENLMALDPGVD